MNEQRAQEIKEAFVNRLRRLRKDAGLTQKELAAETGVHESFLSVVERGIKAPGLDFIVGVARALDVRVGELFPDDESYPEEVVDFLIWLRENPDVSMRDVIRKLAGSD